MLCRIPGGFALLLLALTVVLLAEGGPAARAADDGKVYKTPQAVFDAAAAAALKKDWKTFHSCLTRDSGEMLAGQMALIGLFIRGFAELDKSGKAKEKLKPLEAVYEKHGLTKEVLDKMQKDAPKKQPTDPKEQAKAMRALVEPVKDKAAFTADLMKALEEINPKKQANPLAGARLENVKIDGDKATGTSVAETAAKKEEKKPIAFVRVGGGWKIELPLPSPATPPKDKGKDKGKP